MEVFISWSGAKSGEVAKSLQKWLSYLFQGVSPWLSKNHITPGVRWSFELADALERINFGIVCLTNENLNSPWILFEAGALSKTLARARFVPYLVDIPLNLLTGPLAQFQAVYADRSGTQSLIEAIAEHIPNNFRNSKTLESVFDKWWPELEAELNKINNEYPVPKVRRPDIRIFTTTDIQILELMAKEQLISKIAQALSMSDMTIRVRIQQIVLKLNAKSRKEAIELARLFELIP